MRCPTKNGGNVELLLDYSAGRLNLETASVLERHMEDCPGCRGFAESQNALWSTFNGWEPEPVSPDFDKKLYARIEQHENAGWWKKIGEPLHLVRRRPMMSAAAGCATVAAAFFLSLPSSEPLPQPVPGKARIETVELEQVERTLEDLEMLNQLSGPAAARDL